MHRAYILHRRNYTDSRSILECWTELYGRVAVSAREPRKKNSTRYMLFTAYEVLWQGHSELKTLKVCEPATPRTGTLTGTGSLCGLYINELILRLLPPWDPNPDIFFLYESTLALLAEVIDRKASEPVLRRFERELLSSLGFGVDYRHCCLSGREIEPDRHYELIVQSGFEQTALPHDPVNGVFRGDEIQATERLVFTGDGQRRAAKYMMRRMLEPLLGARPLKSRDLFF